jgi:5-(carboxyamino)imidazole ribonucleotide mutase
VNLIQEKKPMTKPFVAILMGSDSDLPVMQSCVDMLKSLGIAHEVNVLSAHRTPDLVCDYIQSSEARGCAIYIAAAGLAAHLAGAVSANTIKPVIGVPLDAGTLGGLDALLSTVQMPGGMPVATTAIGKPGAKNAGILAAQILAIHDAELADALKKMRSDKRASLIAANQALQSSHG